MPGPDEQGYELEPSHVHASGDAAGTDPPRARDRPAAGSAENLEQRQNRLPPGHPSSRFEDDGTPKQPLVPLKNLELPELGEDREHNGAGRDQAARDGPSGNGAERWQAGSVAEDGQADTSAWAVPPGRQSSGAPEFAVTKPDVWTSADQESRPADPVDPELQAWQSVDPGPAEVGADDQWTALDHKSPAPDQESADDAEIAEDQPGQDADPADADAADAAMADVGAEEVAEVAAEEVAAEDDADADRAGVAAADADAEDAQPATQDHEPIADSAAAAPAEAKRAEALTPEQVRIAVRAHGRCRLAEGRSVFGTYGESGLTPAMRRIEEELDHGKLVPDTEKYALKSLDRFQEKLAKQIARNPDKTPEELAQEIHDGVRYTFVFNEDYYYDAVWQAHRKLEEKGFDLEFRRNTWADPEYKGLNSRWHDSTHDTFFEIQFHTVASFDAKQRTHDAYQKISDTTIPSAERAQLRDAQKEVSATVPLPPRCSEIPDYRKEGK